MEQLPSPTTPALGPGLPNRGFHRPEELPTCPSTGQDNHLTSEPMSGVPREDRRDQQTEATRLLPQSREPLLRTLRVSYA